MAADPVVEGLHRLASSDAALWGERIGPLALEPGGGFALRASRPGWDEHPVPPAAASLLLAHPDALPDDPLRAFRNRTLATVVAIIARDGVVGACAVHDGGAAALCDDVASGGWRKTS